MLTVFVPLALGWVYPNIFSPVHIIFLELIMGPTCSIIYENEPMEKNTMQQKPRPFTNTFFNWKELSTSIVQGLMITAGALIIYQYAAQNGFKDFFCEARRRWFRPAWRARAGQGELAEIARQHHIGGMVKSENLLE